MVSVEAVFRVIDRASAPLRRMEKQAAKTQAAIDMTGRSYADLGSNDTIRGLEKLEARQKEVAQGSSRMEKQTTKTTRAMRSQRGEVRNLGDAVARLGTIFAGVGRIMRPAMFVAILSVIQPLVASVGALAGGVTALLPKLMDLSGVAAALPATLTGIGLAMGTAKLAFNDFGKALAGNKKALAAMTPDAKSFIATLKQYKPVLNDLRKAAQGGGLFSGLEYSIRRLQRGVPVLQQLITAMSGAMGRQSKQWANFLTQGQNLQDISQIGGQGVNIFERMSAGARNLTAALIDVAAVARPLTDYLTKGLLNATKSFRDFIQTSRDNGRLDAFFQRTQKAVAQMVRIGGNLGRTFLGLMRAARPLGDSLWDAFERGTKAMDRFTNSTRGQRDLRAWFDGLKPTLHALGGLTSDLARALGRMTSPENQTRTASLIESMRKWVPILESIFDNASKAFGPEVIDGITQLGRLVENLVRAGGGPLGQLVKFLTVIVTGVNDLVDAFPALGTVMVAAFSMVAANRLYGRIRVFGGEVVALAAKWRGVTVAAEGAATAQAAAMGAPVGVGGTPVGRGVTGAARGPLAATTPGAVVAGAPAGYVSRGARLAGVGSRLAGPLGIAGVVGGTMAGQAIGGTAGGVISGVASGAGLGATVGSVVPGLGTAVGAGVGAAAGGILGYLGSASGAKRNAGLAGASAAAARQGQSAAQLRGQIGHIEGRLAQTTQRPTGMGRGGVAAPTVAQNVVSGNDRTRAKAELASLKAMYAEQKKIDDAAAAERRTSLDRQSRDNAKSMLVSFGQAYDVIAKREGPEAAMGKTVTGMLGKMKGMRSSGARVLAQNSLRWAQEQAKGNPKFLAQVDRLEAGIKSRFSSVGHHVQIVNGRILTGSQNEWKQIGAAITTPLERARQDAHTAFTAIQREAVGSLKAMGFSDTDARALVQNSEKAGGATTMNTAAALQGGNAGEQAAAGSIASQVASGGIVGNVGQTHGASRAKGGRIPGTGLQDTVPIGNGTIAAPGEMVVNRHTEARIDRKLSQMGTSLNREVSSETKKHSDNPGRPPANIKPQGNVMPGLKYGGRSGIQGTTASGGAAAGGNYQAMVAEANQIEGAGYPYSWGGGHNPAFSGPYDCSGSVSAVLHAGGVLSSPLTSGALASWGAEGPGLVTIYANPTHTYMSLDGHYFGTSTSNPGGGAGYFDGAPRAGFTVRHVPGLNATDAAGASYAATAGAAGAGAGAAPVQQMAALSGGKSGLKGVPGALADRARAAVAAGMTQKINAALTAQGGGGGGAAPAGGGVMTATQVAALAESVGLPGLAFAQIAKGESGFNPRAVGHDPGGTQGLGLWQITTKYNDDIIARFGGRDAMFNPNTNAQAAKAIYDRAGIGAWYGTRYLTDPTAHYTGGNVALAKGGRVGQASGSMQAPEWGGWWGNGGDIVAKRPTMIGVGESGTETISIRKGSGGGKGDRTMHNHFHIDGGSNVEAQIERALMKVASALDMTPLEDDGVND